MALSWFVAVLLGALQGFLEWLPVSSEGVVSLVLSSLLDTDPFVAVQLSLFLHLGTAIAATGYYRDEIRDLLGFPVEDRSDLLGVIQDPEVRFLLVGTLSSGLVGIVVFSVLESILSGLPTRAFLLGIGVLLVVTGLVQKIGSGNVAAIERRPRFLDAILVGIGQGLALLPGVSRSGTTVSILLIREYETEQSIELSFLLAITTSVGAAVLVVLETGHIPRVPGGPALGAVVASIVVGYLTIDALVRLVRRTPFWLVCLVFGGLVILTGLL